MTVDPIPKGAQIVTPYLLVEDADREMAFLAAAFGAVQRVRQTRPDGSVMHIELEIGGTQLMLGEPREGRERPTASGFFLRVEDCDAVYALALAEGAASEMEPMDMTHAGERYGGVRDPAGNTWWIATHIEDVSPEEEARRIEELAKGEVSPWS